MDLRNTVTPDDIDVLSEGINSTIRLKTFKYQLKLDEYDSDLHYDSLYIFWSEEVKHSEFSEFTIHTWGMEMTVLVWACSNAASRSAPNDTATVIFCVRA